MTRLRFGILGMSEGNGHPYSWAAIFNGYDRAAMASCPFPVIPDYLSRRSFPADAIAEATVTHVWTQDRRTSEHIAAASRIAHVVDDAHDMIGKVDGVLLARDDAESHEKLAAPFLEVGLPVYIDKPFALNVAAGRSLLDLQKRPGQIFTCSALAYARELTPDTSQLAALGPLRRVEASTVKDWDRYAMHVIEPLCRLLAPVHGIPDASPGSGGGRLDLTWPDGPTGTVVALGTARGDIRIRLEGEAGALDLVFQDSFSAFRAALRHFTDIVLGRAPPQNPDDVLALVRLVEAGRR